MKITNGVTEVRYCGDLTGRDLLVSGKYVVLTFHTDWLLENKRGFEIFLLKKFPVSLKRSKFGIPPFKYGPLQNALSAEDTDDSSQE